jgi:hypothetical protein
VKNIVKTKIISAPRTDVESKIIANVVFCLVNSLNLDPARLELRSGNIYMIVHLNIMFICLNTLLQH